MKEEDPERLREIASKGGQKSAQVRRANSGSSLSSNKQ
jgi:general stress protein YciG